MAPKFPAKQQWVACVACLALVPALLAGAPVAEGSRPAAGDYVIGRDGEAITARDAQTGKIVDSGADAAAVIQGRLDALPQAGGRVLLRPGAYTLSHGLKIRRSHTVIEGEGYLNTVLKLADNVNDNVIEYMPRVELAPEERSKRKWEAVLLYVACRNLTIDGNREHNTKGSGIVGPLSRSAFTDLHVLNVAEDGLCFPWGGTGHKLTRLVVEKCGRYGIHMGITDSWITDCTVARTDDAGIAVYAGATKIHHAHVWGCHIGIQAGLGKWGNSSVWIYDSYIESNSQEGVLLGPRRVYRSVIDGCTFMKNSLGKPYTWSDISGVVEKPYQVSDVIIRGNTFFGRSKEEKGNTLHNVCLGPESWDNTIVDNVFSTTCKGSPVVHPGGTNRVAGNLHFATASTGTVTIPAGQTAVDVPHELAEAPTTTNLTPTCDTLGKRYWVETKAPRTFTIRIDSPAATGISFDWAAAVAGRAMGTPGPRAEPNEEDKHE